MAHDATNCQEFCCSDFCNKPIESCRRLLQIPFDLDNEIHPLFAQSRFVNLSSDEYESLMPVLRLASRLLLSDQAAVYFLTILDGERYHLHENDPMRRGNPYKAHGEIPFAPKLTMYPRKDQRQATPEVKAKVEIKLLAMLEAVHFEVSDEVPDARIEALPMDDNWVNPHKFLETWPLGWPTKILIPTKTLKRYVKHLNGRITLDQPDEEENIALKNANAQIHARIDGVKLAMTLVHEIAHSLNRARDYRPLYEPFYKASTVAECGFELQNCLIGGVLLGWHFCYFPATGKIKQILCQRKWPCGGIVDLYKHNDSEIGHRLENPKYGSLMRVPTTFVLQFHDTKFWTEAVPRYRGQPIRPSGPEWIYKLPPVETGGNVEMCSLNDPNLSGAFWERLSKLVHREKRKKDRQAVLSSDTSLELIFQEHEAEAV